MNHALKAILTTRLVAVIRLDDYDKAVAVGLGGEWVRKQSVAQDDWASISAQALACLAAVPGRGTR